MSELRRDPFSGDWVLLAPERKNRPLLKEDSICPFCPGHEDLTPKEVDRDPEGGERWQIRVIPNKYPALSPIEERTSFEDLGQGGRCYGEHQVIIEHSEHDLEFYDYSKEHVQRVLKVYKRRMKALSKPRYVEHVVLFKNSGTAAGATISHPHSQILSLPFIPQRFLKRMELFQEFSVKSGDCMMCRMLKEEMARGDYIIDENSHFVVMTPYASQLPYLIWIVPQEHSPSFTQLTQEEIESLSIILKRILGSMGNVLQRPAFNFIFHSTPKEKTLYHWHLELFPRITTIGGFEGASGVMINTVDPREAKEQLKLGLTTV